MKHKTVNCMGHYVIFKKVTEPFLISNSEECDPILEKVILLRLSGRMGMRHTTVSEQTECRWTDKIEPTCKLL